MLAADMHQNTEKGQIFLQRADKLRGGGTAGHLHEAGPAGGGAGEAGIDADRPRGPVGNGQAIAEGRKGHGDEEGGGREKPERGRRQAQEPAQGRHAAAHQHHAVDAHALGKAARQEVAQHVARGDQRRTTCRIPSGVRLQHVDHDVGRAAEEGEEDR